MKLRKSHLFYFFIILIAACNTDKKAVLSPSVNESVFPKGEITKSPNFTGTVWVQMMGENKEVVNARFGHVTFDPKARTNWHLHPGGQILFVTEGMGYHQIKGQPVQALKSGDVVEVPPNTLHWHGAAAAGQFAHIAVSLNSDKGGAVWFEPVTEDEYPSEN